MKRLCRNCASCSIDNNDTLYCVYLNTPLAQDANPPPNSVCWERKPKLSGEALSLIRSRAGMKGGSRSGYGNGGTPTQQTCIRKMDHDVLKGYAALKNISLAETVHRLCLSLTKQYPDLKTELWRD